MVIDMDLQLMKASTVANQGFPNIKGWPPSRVLGCKTTKSSGYSQESTEITMSSITPSGLMVDWSGNSRIVRVGQTYFPSCNNCFVSICMMLIAAPKSTNTSRIIIWPIFTVSVGLLGQPYLIGGVFPSIS